MRRGSGSGGWSCGSLSWNGGCGWTAPIRGRRRRRSGSGRGSGAARSGARGMPRSGSGARTASRAGSPGIRAGGCRGTRSLMSGGRATRRRRVARAGAAGVGRREAAGFGGGGRAARGRERVRGVEGCRGKGRARDPDRGTGEPVPGAAQVMVIRTPGEKLIWLQALASRRAEGITALLAFFTGFLIVDGYTAYQQLSGQLAGIQQCCQPVIRRCRAVAKLGPGSLQSWAAEVITVLREAHQAVEDARSRGQPALDAGLLKGLRERYDEAVASGITHNRLRDWDGDGNHPGYALGCWLREHADQVWLFTTAFEVEWTSNSAVISSLSPAVFNV